MKDLFTLEHIGLAASDPAALKDWYARVLGAALVHQIAQTPPAFLLTLGGMMIEIYSAESTTELTRNNKLGGWRHLALKVNSLEAAAEHLRTMGVAITEPVKPAGGGGRVLFFSDPEGNLLHLVERLAGGWT